MSDPEIGRMARLQQIIRGIKSQEVEKEKSQKTSHPRLPITPHILSILHGVWRNGPDQKSTSLLWAAACLAFFGFLLHHSKSGLF